MSSDLATRPTGALAVTSDQDAFTDAQLDAYGIREATRGEQLVFLHTIQKTGLDPAAKQIYMIGRKDRREERTKYTIQTGIDGFRLIADRTGLYAGSDEEWTDGKGRFPASATVTVWKLVQGNLRPFRATAHWDEYVQTYGRDNEPNRMWSKMPRRMLAKCAEALALRKAFPQELSGIYTSEEMGQADSHVEVTVEPETATPAAGIAAQDPTARTRELQDIALKAALDATDAATREDLVALWNSIPKPCTPLDVRAVVTDAQLAAATQYTPELEAAKEHLPLVAWLQACAACITQGGTSVADASAYDEPETAEPEPVPTP